MVLKRTSLLTCNIFDVLMFQALLQFYEILLTELINFYNLQTLSHLDPKSCLQYFLVVFIFNVLSVHEAQCSVQCWIMQRVIIKLT